MTNVNLSSRSASCTPRPGAYTSLRPTHLPSSVSWLESREVKSNPGTANRLPPGTPQRAKHPRRVMSNREVDSGQRGFHGLSHQPSAPWFRQRQRGG
ncbi:hypothetical protein DH86_00004360 [Scytalidium sp. 3C]|nr:hypothetical protein DH86_00004360 [Scytalidium sp. 3C]